MNNIVGRLGLVASRPLLDNLVFQEVPRLSAVFCRTMYNFNRHRDPKYRKERMRKVWKVDLPDFDKMRQEDDRLSPDQIRSMLKEKGIVPPQPWNERELFNASTNGVIDPYVPPQGDWKSSSLKEKLKKPLTGGLDLVKTRRELSTIRLFEGEEFDLKVFATEATDIYIKAHRALADKDEKKMFDHVTEYCFPLMTAGLKFNTVKWEYLGDVEPPTVVQVRANDLVAKGNKFSQITVRLHTKQMLAVFDRHGRLVHGSPTDVKEVLEYVVFEKYLANEYGAWRIHTKIRPNDQGLTPQVSKTYVLNRA
mgnify:CR=1 FL=1